MGCLGPTLGLKAAWSERALGLGQETVPGATMCPVKFCFGCMAEIASFVVSLNDGVREVHRCSFQGCLSPRELGA